MDPVLGRVVVEREQDVEVVGDLRGRLRPLDAELGGERLGRRLGRGSCPRRCRSRPGPVSRPGGPTWAGRRGRCRSCATNTSARPFRGTRRGPLSRTRARRHRPRAPERSCRGVWRRGAGRPTTRLDSRNPSASATSSLRPSARTPMITSRHTLSASSRTFRWIPSTHTVDIVAAGQRPGVERPRLVLPLGRQPGDRRRGQALVGAEELLQRRPEVRAGQAVQIQQRQHLRHPRGSSATTPAGSLRRTGAAHRVTSSIRLSLTRGCRTGTAPAAVVTSRGSWKPLRTTSRRPSSSTSPRWRRHRRRPRPATPPPASAGRRRGRSHPTTTCRSRWARAGS